MKAIGWLPEAAARACGYEHEKTRPSCGRTIPATRSKHSGLPEHHRKNRCYIRVFSGKPPSSFSLCFTGEQADSQRGHQQVRKRISPPWTFESQLFEAHLNTVVYNHILFVFIFWRECDLKPEPRVLIPARPLTSSREWHISFVCQFLQPQMGGNCIYLTSF